MFKRRKSLIIGVIIFTVFFILSYPLNRWLAATMFRHQIIELLGILSLGIIFGASLKHFNIKDISWGIALLVFISFSLIFWMIPRSVDLAVINPSFNKLMNWHILFCGTLVIPILRNTILEIKIAFIGMSTAMFIATGIALRSFDILLCSSFNIPQQKEAGGYLLIIGLSLFVFNIILLFTSLTKKKIKEP